MPATRALSPVYHPGLEEYRRLATEGTVVPVYREILADLETPVSAFRKLGRGANSYLLESIEEASTWGRYSIIGLSPSIVVRAEGGAVRVARAGKRAEAGGAGDPLRVVESLLRERRLPESETLPRFSGGAVGYLSYDYARHLETLPSRAKRDLDLPDAVFLFSDLLLVFDNLTHTVKVIALARPEGRRGAAAAYADAVRRIETTIRDLRGNGPARGVAGARARSAASESRASGSAAGRGARGPAGGRAATTTTLSRDAFQKRVETAKRYIREGDAFQIVLSHRVSTKVACDPFDIYRALRTINPSPYMYYFDFGDFQIAGSSPEVLVRESAGTVEVRPIAGTRPRGRDAVEDRRFEAELLADEKERAEHVMLVDLGRNDVGRVCRYGSVVTREFMTLERYSHVMHLVSHVTGATAPGVGAFDVLRACFPAGTVTGAPKVRAMEIIDELEPSRRGVYAGAIGYFGYSGAMDMCISIRTVLVKDGVAHVGVGAGIVADSDPAREHDETMNKGRALFEAIRMAQEGID